MFTTNTYPTYVPAVATVSGMLMRYLGFYLTERNGVRVYFNEFDNIGDCDEILAVINDLGYEFTVEILPRGEFTPKNTFTTYEEFLDYEEG